MNKRNTLTDLVSQFSINDLEKESPEQKKPEQKPSSKKRSKETQKKENTNLLDKLKQQHKGDNTRITLDLDPETYRQLNQLSEYTGMTKAKLLRALIHETAKLLQK